MEKAFNFGFKDTQKGVSYLAKFLLPDTLILKRITGVKSNRTSLKLQSTNHDPWSIFCQHATFEDVFSGYDPKDKDDWLSEPLDWDKIKLSFKYRGRTETLRVFRESRFLEKIAVNPYLLKDEMALDSLIHILVMANKGTERERRQAKEYLRLYLIPLHPGGKKHLNQVKCVRFLAKKLAAYLAAKCVNYLKTDCDYGNDLKLTLKDGWLNTFDNLNLTLNDGCLNPFEVVVKWTIAQDESRIAFMSPEDLRSLLTKPARFADQLVERATGVSQRTLKRRS